MRNVCQIFTDVSGKPVDRMELETAAIQFWLKEGWNFHDFRLVFEHQIHDEEAKKYFERPGFFNIHTILNPKRSAILRDILMDLRFLFNRKDKQKLETALNPRPLILLACGEKIPAGDNISYSMHMDHCYETKGACFF